MNKKSALIKIAKTGRKTESIFFIVYCCLFMFTLTLSAQTYSELEHLDGYKTDVYYSKGNEERAKTIAVRCDNVIAYYKKQIEFEPSVKVLILNPENWKKYTKFPVYGMPHYNDNQTLIIASEDNDFWKSFIPPVEKLPDELAKQITRTYTDNKGNLTMQAFFDLLAIHELGHAYHFQAGLTMQRKWMGELFANILLQTYIADNEPGLLPALLVFPKIVVDGGKAELKYTSLTDFESKYEELGKQYPQNYGWYQCRLHLAAEQIYNAGRAETFKKLWATLKIQEDNLSDNDFATLLSKNVHQSVADVLLKWDE